MPFCIITVTGDATYYDLGMTACGQTYTDNDLVAAIAFNYFKKPNPNEDEMCGKKAIAKGNGKSVTVMIKDKCGSCKEGDIDLSKAAFRQLSDLSVGRFQVTWDFIN